MIFASRFSHSIARYTYE